MVIEFELKDLLIGLEKKLNNGGLDLTYQLLSGWLGFHPKQELGHSGSSYSDVVEHQGTY